MEGLIGVLLLRGLKRDNHVASTELSIFSLGHLCTSCKGLKEGFAFCWMSAL